MPSNHGLTYGTGREESFLIRIKWRVYRLVYRTSSKGKSYKDVVEKYIRPREDGIPAIDLSACLFINRQWTGAECDASTRWPSGCVTDPSIGMSILQGRP